LLHWSASWFIVLRAGTLIGVCLGLSAVMMSTPPPGSLSSCR